MAKSAKIRAKNTENMFIQKELQVIRPICDQASNEEMAVKLKRSMRTIEGYRANIIGKMKAKSTAGMVIYAVKAGIYTIR